MTPEDIAARMTGRIEAAGPGRAEAFLASPVAHNHAAFLTWLPDGALACAWFGGTLEGRSDIFIHLATLAPGADAWSAASRVSDDPDRSEQNPVIFTDPETGAPGLFHTAQPGGRQEECVVRFRPLEIGQGAARSGKSRTLDLPKGSFVRAALTPRDDGAWMLPLFLCRTSPGARWTGSHDVAAVATSTDRGASWDLVEVPGSTGCVHMTLVPLGQGRIAAFFRRRQADFVYRSESADGGRSWSVPEATDVPNNNSSIVAVALADGRVALLCNPVNAAQSDARRESLYDELGEGDDGRADPAGGVPAIWGVPRAPLTLCLSEDGGRSFPRRRVVEDGPGTCLSNNALDGKNQELSYPAMVEAPDGALHLAFTFHRRAIKHVVLDRSWIDAI
ncbi:sialidase family protein [Amaricoccus solimangrovi]|uniref:Glycosyl hydrolase n=1 Tax=Amaricoccus solimangrovi TaxID=2589815 RepID=A0A501WTI8_9RHOB|nr:exo-alpha-sialidase [Amaricoccus solimangrovi]TPE51424.1 glycosyl hydrolase [Amaricoccus solimangrovi]